MNSLDWDVLVELRQRYLSETAGQLDYWKSQHVLEQYDQVYGRRILWKWEGILALLAHCAWDFNKTKVIVDWGCGTGVASEAYLPRLASSETELLLWDKSELALEFSLAKLKSQFPSISMRKMELGETLLKGFTLLLSHVISELSERKLNELIRLASGAGRILWVEPGTPKVSQKLIEVREKFMGHLKVIAPCPHQSPCGLNGRVGKDWCHHFIQPPQEVFHSGVWTEIGRRLQIDLRSLPVSYLAMDSGKGPAQADFQILGRPRRYKGQTKVLWCDAHHVESREISQKKDSDLYEAVTKLDSDFAQPPFNFCSQKEEPVL